MAVRALLMVLAALFVVVLGAGPAAAAPVEVSARLTDDAGVLDAADRTAVGDLLDGVAQRTGLGIYVVFVPSFGTATADDWAERTAELSELDASDVLVAVAVEDGSYEYTWWTSDESSVDEGDVASIFTDDVEPLFDSGNWAAGIRTAGEELESAVGGAAAENAEQERAQWSGTTVTVTIAAVLVVLLAAHLLSRRRRVAVG